MVFEVEIVIELFWSVGGGVRKATKTELPSGRRRKAADSNSARRVQLIDMLGGGSTNRGVPFYITPGSLCDLTCGLARYPAHAQPQRAAALVLMRPTSPPVCVGGRWTSVDVAVWATGCCRGATTDGSAHTRGRQDQPNDKDQWAWVSADTVFTTGCDPWVLAIALRPSSRQSTDTGGFGPMGSCRSSRASRRLHSSN